MNFTYKYLNICLIFIYSIQNFKLPKRNKKYDKLYMHDTKCQEFFIACRETSAGKLHQ